MRHKNVVEGKEEDGEKVMQKKCIIVKCARTDSHNVYSVTPITRGALPSSYGSSKLFLSGCLPLGHHFTRRVSRETRGGGGGG